jgi:hypothetical protein
MSAAVSPPPRPNRVTTDKLEPLGPAGDADEAGAIAAAPIVAIAPDTAELANPKAPGVQRSDTLREAVALDPSQRSESQRPGAAGASESQPPQSVTAVQSAGRRSDTLREATAFDDLVDNTNPEARRDLLEEGPESSERTEVLAKPHGLFDGADELKHPTYHVSDDVPTVVTNVTQEMIDAARNGMQAMGQQEPPSTRVAESFFGASEQATKRWHAEEAAQSRDLDGPLQTQTPSTRPKRRVGVAVVIGLVVVAAVVAGIGLWMRANGARNRAESRGARPNHGATATAAVRDGLTGASVAPTTLADVGTSADAATAADAGTSADAATAAVSAEPSVTPVAAVAWAPIDDGSPLEGYPPVEDFQGGGKGRLLADRYGYLVLRFPEAAFIYQDSIAVGATNWKIATTCGEKTLRVGVGTKPITWLSDEAKVNVICRDTTQVVFRRLAGVVVPTNATRPIAPGSMPARKANAKSSEDGVSPGEPSGDGEKVAPAEPPASNGKSGRGE